MTGAEIDVAEERYPAADSVLYLHDGAPLRVHKRSQCMPPCAVHAPSGHPLVGAPLDWNDVTGQLLRLCDCKFWHPDPDDFKVRLDPARLRHDCCELRCCSGQVIDGTVVTKTLELTSEKEI